MQPASLLPKLSSPSLRSLSCFRCIPLTSTLLNSVQLSLSLLLHIQRFTVHTHAHTKHSSRGNEACHWSVQGWFGWVCINQMYSRRCALPLLSHITVAQLCEGSNIGTASVSKTGNEVTGIGMLSGVKQELKSEELAWWMVQYESLGVLCSTDRAHD